MNKDKNRVTLEDLAIAIGKNIIRGHPYGEGVLTNEDTRKYLKQVNDNNNKLINMSGTMTEEQIKVMLKPQEDYIKRRLEQMDIKKKESDLDIYEQLIRAKKRLLEVQLETEDWCKKVEKTKNELDEIQNKSTCGYVEKIEYVEEDNSAFIEQAKFFIDLSDNILSLTSSIREQLNIINEYEERLTELYKQ